jgi:hypothetical protein
MKVMTRSSKLFTGWNEDILVPDVAEFVHAMTQILTNFGYTEKLLKSDIHVYCADPESPPKHIFEGMCVGTKFFDAKVYFGIDP